MRTFIKLGSLALTTSLMLAFGCGSDDDGGGDGGDGGTSSGGTGGDGGGTSSTAASGGTTSDAGGTTGSTTDAGGNSGTDGTTTTSSTNGTAGGGGDGGAPPDDEFEPYDNAEATADDGGPSAEVTGAGVGAFTDSDDWHVGWTNFSTDSSGTDACDGALTDLPIESDGTFSATETVLTKDGSPYNLDVYTYVAADQTLTIEPGVVFCGGPTGALIVSRDGKIDAVGTSVDPIIFTSAAAEGEKNKGDWLGVILLGNAKNFKSADVLIEGLSEEDRNLHGGDDDADSSGTMQYVRIEFGGFELTAGNEINGLTFGSVGSGTTIDHIEVNTTLDDCYEWFGGTVNVDHLVCYNAGDDMFDGDLGWRGSLDTALGIGVDPLSEDPNGFELDSDLAGAEPTSNVTATNVTLSGTGEEEAGLSYGMVLRENFEGTFSNIVISGFNAGVDTRDDFGSASSPHVTIEDSKMFNNLTFTVAYDEDDSVSDSASPSFDDDGGFDERTWFADGEGNEEY